MDMLQEVTWTMDMHQKVTCYQVTCSTTLSEHTPRSYLDMLQKVTWTCSKKLPYLDMFQKVNWPCSKKLPRHAPRSYPLDMLQNVTWTCSKKLPGHAQKSYLDMLQEVDFPVICNFHLGRARASLRNNNWPCTKGIK